MSIVFIFLLLNLPRLVVGLYEVFQIRTVLGCYQHAGYHKAGMLQDIVDIIARYLSVLNSSINFLIYCMIGSR